MTACFLFIGDVELFFLFCHMLALHVESSRRRCESVVDDLPAVGITPQQKQTLTGYEIYTD